MHSANIRQRCERVFIYTTDSFRRVESRGTRVRYTRRTSPSTAAPRYVSFLLRLSRFSTVLYHLANRSHSPPSNLRNIFLYGREGSQTRTNIRKRDFHWGKYSDEISPPVIISRRDGNTVACVRK